jgi:hypothetical protein
MREITLNELESQLAEQLPARELMGACCHSCTPCQPSCPPPPPPCCCGGGIEVSVNVCIGL